MSKWVKAQPRGIETDINGVMRDGGKPVALEPLKPHLDAFGKPLLPGVVPIPTATDLSGRPVAEPPPEAEPEVEVEVLVGFGLPGGRGDCSPGQLIKLPKSKAERLSKWGRSYPKVRLLPDPEAERRREADREAARKLRLERAAQAAAPPPPAPPREPPPPLAPNESVLVRALKSHGIGVGIPDIQAGQTYRASFEDAERRLRSKLVALVGEPESSS